MNEKLDDDLEYFRRQIEHSLEADEHVCQNFSVSKRPPVKYASFYFIFSGVFECTSDLSC